jgi:molecular chaperone DnaJ
MRKEWLETDYYAELGVSKNAEQKDIKKAFRKLARDHHPDANEGNPDAEAKFKQINQAYEVLGNEETRKEYDHARDMGYFVGGPQGAQQYVRVEDLFAGGGAGGGSPFDVSSGERLSDLFGRSGSRPQAGSDIAADLSLTFHESMTGVTKQINVGGNTVKVKIPVGVDDGARIRLTGKGAPGIRGGPPGDAFVTVHVAEHPLFARSGRNLGITVPILFVEATLGAEIDVPTLEGTVRLRIPAGTKSGKTFRVSERGVTTTKARGDLLVTVEVSVPTTVTDEQRALLEKLRDNGLDDNPRAHLGV